MSTTQQKRRRAEALKDAEDLKTMFPPSSYVKWEFAGSVRRMKPEVSDVEHVVQPAFGPKPGFAFGLFGDEPNANLLFHHLDLLIAKKTVMQHVYGTHPNGSPMYRWGEKYRGVDFRGFNHEFFCADEKNWGAVLMIRTGPAEYSRNFVDALKRGGAIRQQDGYLIDVATREVIPVSTEEEYFRKSGTTWVNPEDRR